MPHIRIGMASRKKGDVVMTDVQHKVRSQLTKITDQTRRNPRNHQFVWECFGQERIQS